MALKNVLGGYDLNNMSLTGLTRDTLYSQTRIVVLYCSQEEQVGVLISTIFDHYTVQTELDDETKETRLKMQEYYTNWAVLENNVVLEKPAFKLKHKLQSFQNNFCLLDWDSAFEKFQQTLPDGIKHYVPEKKIKVFQT